MTQPPTVATEGARRNRTFRTLGRLLGRAGIALLAVIAGWVALAVHPQPLFAHTAERHNIVLHARAPLPAEAGPLLDDVARRVARSPIYDPARIHHVFLCDTPGLFALFALWDRNVGALSMWHLGGNVFIRPHSILRNSVIGPRGDEKRGERTLAYYIAHELAHTMSADHVGHRRYFNLAAFQQEGYADYVAFARPVDLAAGRAALARGDKQMSPSRSGLYKKYELMVAHLLERRGLTVDDILLLPLNRRAVEHDLLAAADL